MNTPFGNGSMVMAFFHDEGKINKPHCMKLLYRKLEYMNSIPFQWNEHELSLFHRISLKLRKNLYIACNLATVLRIIPPRPLLSSQSVIEMQRFHNDVQMCIPIFRKLSVILFSILKEHSQF